MRGIKKFTKIFVCYIALVVLAAFGAAYVMEAEELQAIDSRLTAAAKALKYMLADDFHDRAVDPDSISFEEEIKNRKAISEYAARAGFTYAYTLVKKDGKFYFAAPTVTDEEAKERKRWYFYPYDDVPEGFNQAMDQGVETFSTYSDQWGTFRSVAVPEISPGGRRYLSCVDVDVSYIRQERAKIFAIAGGVALLLILSSLPLLIMYHRSNEQYASFLLELNTELASANAQMQELDTVKSSMLTKVSHELRTPLTSIIGFMKIVARDFERYFAPLSFEDEQLHARQQRIEENLSTVIDESQRLMRLVNDCLDLSKIELGKMEWRDMELSPESFIRTALNALRGESEQNPEVKLLTEVTPGLPCLMVDPDKMHQLLINLVGNALKFTASGHVALRADKQGEFLRMQIEDTGIGIRKEDQEKIFDEFYRSLNNDTLLDLRKGTGLGLAICSQIVEHYGGSISVESEYGSGTTFTVLLPFS